MIYLGYVRTADLAEIEDRFDFAVNADSYADAAAKVSKEIGNVYEFHMEEIGDGNVVWFEMNETAADIKKNTTF